MKALLTVIIWTTVPWHADWSSLQLFDPGSFSVLTQKMILLSGWLTSLMCMGRFKLPMISSDNTNPVWREHKVFSTFLSRQTVTKPTDVFSYFSKNPICKNSDILKSAIIEDNIFIRIVFTILKNKMERQHLNKISHRETTGQNMGRPTLIQK